jgi:DNA-binding transcriptional MerR regulator
MAGRSRGGELFGTPPGRNWRDRVGDPSEPLFTMAVTIDLLGTSHQTLRRLESALGFDGTRSGGNHRRYSFDDLELLSTACDLNDQGFSPVNVAKILELQRREG